MTNIDPMTGAPVGGAPQLHGGSTGGLAWVGNSIGELALKLATLLGLVMSGGAALVIDKLTNLQQQAFHHNPILKSSPAALAEMVVKGAVGGDWATDEASYSGVSPQLFDRMVAATGNPPGPAELLTMWRRGIIGPGDVDRGLRQGYSRNDWIEQIAALRDEVLSPAGAVAAAVQNQLPFAEAQAIAARSGITAEDFQTLYNVAGNPPGAIEMLNLWVRGYISEADVDQGLRESHLKNKWIAPLKNLARRKVPMRTITTLLGHGAIDDARALRMLAELGYAPDDAQAIVASAKRVATTPHKEASATTIRALYVDRVIGRDEARADLVKLGYADHDADLLLTLADDTANQRLRQASIGKIHSLFFAHHMTVADARQHLAALNVPADRVDYMLTLWQLEEQANVHELTPAQIVSAGKKGVFNEAEVLARLERFGYHPDDAMVLGVIGGAIAPPAP